METNKVIALGDLHIQGQLITEPVNVQVINKSENDLPQYETIGAAGLDVKAVLGKSNIVILSPGDRALIKTGLFVEIPQGYEIQVRSRSGLAYKNGVCVLNGIGTIDSDYRGEIGVILVNHGTNDFIINDGDRIAQLVLAKHERINWITSTVISQTDRGTGGYGSTGTK